jgi:Uncharacterized proteins, LmbE homologs
MSSKRMIVIAPHADDEILGCGATIAKYIDSGFEIFVIVATKGDLSMFLEERVLNVRREALEAHKFLGVKETFFFDFPAPKLNVVPECDISNALFDVFKSVKPCTIFIPHPSDLHQDHKAIYRSSLVPARPIYDYKVEEIYCYETLSETNWAPIAANSFFIPNLYIDVSNYFEKKLEAMRIFKSQLKPFPNSRSLEAIDALATYRGTTIGAPKAEAFVIERQIIF